MRLFHVSDSAHIKRFQPRERHPDPAVVWAIDEEHLANYLLPRDCPRVTFLPESGIRVIAVESGWLDRIRSATLWIYEVPVETFTLLDANAGYFVSRSEVMPLAHHPVADVLSELVRRQIELRIVPSLWPIHDFAVSSGLEFSCIRMRNAQPRIPEAP